MRQNRENSSKALRIVIAGGGYAGLSALIILRKKLPYAQIVLIDPRDSHLLITRLHETVHGSLEDISIPYQDLARRFDFQHIRQALEIDMEKLQLWQKRRCIEVDRQQLDFDYLLLATGASVIDPVPTEGVIDLDELCRHPLSAKLEKIIADGDKEHRQINIIGAGPTGIQFAFAIEHILYTARTSFRITLIDAKDRLLEDFPAAMVGYVQKRLAEKNIQFLNSRFFVARQEEQIVLENRRSKQQQLLPDDLTLLLLGKKPEPLLHANTSGQVVLDGEALSNIFTAGDCSCYDELGSNRMTMQTALRKGKAAAKNILRAARVIRFCLPYMHQDKGYILHLGPADAVGWVGSSRHIISGMPACLAKEAIEMQYTLLLEGVDSYVL